MTAVAFDTLKFARAPGSEPISRPGRRRGCPGFADAVQGGLPARADLQSLEGAVKAEFVAVRAEMKSEFAAVRPDMKLLEQRVTIKLGVMLVALVGILLAAIRYMPAR
jgi:hypothetical protein